MNSAHFFGHELLPPARDPEALLRFFDDRFDQLSGKKKQSLLSRLGHCGDERATARLIEVLRSGHDEMLRTFAADGLGRHVRSEQVERALCDGLIDNSPMVRRTVISALCRLGCAQCAEQISRGLDDEDPYVQSAALRAMRQFKFEPAAERIAALLDAEQSSVRNLAANALAEAGDAGSVDRLVIVRQAPRSARPRRINIDHAIADIQGRLGGPASE